VPQQINLYNPAFEEQRALLSWRGVVAGWTATAVLIAAIVVYQTFSLRSADKQERELSAQAATAQAETQRLGALLAARKADARIAEEIAHLEAEIKGREDVMTVLKSGGLGDTRGFSDHLKAFARQSFDGVWLTGLSIATAGRDVSIEGRALQAGFVPGYLKRLNGESAMQGHPFSELLIQMPPPEPGSKTTEVPNYVEFRLTTKSDAAALQGTKQ
jgi:Tfp pilus assembly protein PilN